MPVPPVAAPRDRRAAVPPPARKVARFITADSAPSTCRWPPTGNCPSCNWPKGEQARAGKSRSIDPLVLVGARVEFLRVPSSLLLADFDARCGADTRDKAARSKELEAYYATRRPARRLSAALREAQQARSRATTRPNSYTTARCSICCRPSRDLAIASRGLTGHPREATEPGEVAATLLAGSR